MTQSFHAKAVFPLVLLIALSLPAVGWGVHQAFRTANNNVSQWLPEGFPQTEVYNRFREVFGSDDVAVVSWEGCTLDDPRLEQFAQAVVPRRGRNGADGSRRWFQRVVTGARLVAVIEEGPFTLSRQEAIRRLQGTLIGPDGKTTCAVVTLSKEGNADRTAALSVIEEIAIEHCGIPREELRLGGDAIINAAIDLESERAVRQWIAFSWAVALATAWLCLRSLKLIAIVFGIAVYSSGITTSLVYFSGGTMNLVLVVMPVLIYVLALSACVHLANYYHDAVRENGVPGAPQRSLAAGWLPCALSAGTTALGLVSLSVSHVVPVRMFGIYASAGMMVSLGIVLLLLPAMLEKWPQEPPRHVGSRAWWRRHLLRPAAREVVRCRATILAIGLPAICLLAVGVVFIDTSVAPGRFFAKDGRWWQDGLWLQDRIGSMTPFEVLLDFPKLPAPDDPDDPYQLTFLERLQLVGRVADVVRSVEYVSGTLSPATFGPSPQPHADPVEEGLELGRTGRAMLRVMGVRDQDWLRKSVLNRRLLRHRHHFENTRFLQPTERGEQWRISARVSGLRNSDEYSHVDYDLVLEEVQRQVDAQLAQEGLTREVVRPVYTGVVPLVFVAQRELLDGLFKSFCLAFALIAVVMTVLLRSPTAGLMSMIPNVFPAVLVFGTMGWLGILVDVGAMMTASVALGIAVDDTLHFLTWFRRSRAAGHSRQAAIVTAYDRCAVAMTQTTLIAGLGLVVFFLSDFQPVSQFGLLMAVLLAAALVGDLVLLPALLATKVGEGFAEH
ncbi:MAG: MMPL family transporter [Thermoguttaceae bacterium]|jgi:predicted RND superfamily exporter protein|nr:MMPL family transporter [Thermoguttaceae bacterium]